MACLKEDPILVSNDIKEDGEEGAKDKVREEGGVKEMLLPAGNSIHRSGSRPQLDLSGAAIQGNNFEERDPTILLPNQSDDISHLALDIGGEFSLKFFLVSLVSQAHFLVQLWFPVVEIAFGWLSIDLLSIKSLAITKVVPRLYIWLNTSVNF